MSPQKRNQEIYDCGMRAKTLARYAMHRRPGIFSARVRRHLKQCPDCRQRLADADAAQSAAVLLGHRLQHADIPADGPDRVIQALRSGPAAPPVPMRAAPRRRYRLATATAMVTLIGTAALVWALAGPGSPWSGARQADTAGEAAANMTTAAREDFSSITAALAERPPGTNGEEGQSDGKTLDTAGVPEQLADELSPYTGPDTEMTPIGDGLLIRAGSVKELSRLAEMIPSLWETATVTCEKCGSPEIMKGTLSDTAEGAQEQDALRTFLTQELPRRQIPVPDPLSGHWLIVTWQVQQE